MSLPASFGLLLIRGIVGYVMFYHGAQKLFTQKFGAFRLGGGENAFAFDGYGGGGIKSFIDHMPDLGVPGVPKEVLAYAAAIAEFGGGILLMLGLATRLAAVPVAFTMGVAAFVVHKHAFSLQNGGMEFALTLMLVAIGLAFTGPGSISVDRLFRRTKVERVKEAPAEKKKK